MGSSRENGKDNRHRTDWRVTMAPNAIVSYDDTTTTTTR